MLAKALLRQFLLPEQAEHNVLINTTVVSKIGNLILLGSLGYLIDSS
jgi:sporulation protein YlmC with PRC-barrel domain